MVVPSFVNAHTHLEIPRQATPCGEGLVAWVRALRSGVPASRAAFDHNHIEARELGIAAVIDISNNGFRGDLPGYYLHEVLGLFDQEPVPPRATPHALYSTGIRRVHACESKAETEGRHWSIHIEEDGDETEFTTRGEGAWRAYHRELGRDVAGYRVTGFRPVEFLDMARLLSPRSILVHCTTAREVDIDLIAERGAAIVLCPRSNLHITGRLPDVPAMIARKVPLMIGTDSLASSPDLDLLAEVAVLRRAFPQIRLSYWLDCLTRVPREVLYLDLPSRLEFDVPDLETLFDGTSWPRRWVA